MLIQTSHSWQIFWHQMTLSHRPNKKHSDKMYLNKGNETPKNVINQHICIKVYIELSGCSREWRRCACSSSFGFSVGFNLYLSSNWIIAIVPTILTWQLCCSELLCILRLTGFSVYTCHPGYISHLLW